MDQVFCSDPLLVADDVRVLIEEIERELKAISLLCPNGEETFERLLQLFGLVIKLSSAEDAHTVSPVTDNDETNRLIQDGHQLKREVEELKKLICLSRQQLDDAEEENLKLLSEKTKCEQVVRSLKRQIETQQQQNSEQNIQLVTKLDSEQTKAQRLRDTVTALQLKLKSAACSKKIKERKCSLAEEMREIGIDAETQTAALHDVQQTTSSPNEKEVVKLQRVYTGSECIPVTEKQVSRFGQLRYFRFFLFLLICVSHQMCSMQPIFYDDILLSFPPEQPPL